MSTQTGIYIPSADTLFQTAHETLFVPNNMEIGKLDSIFGRLMGHHLDYADLYFQYTRSEGWSLEEGQVKSGSFNIEQGVGVRAVSGEKTAFAYSDDISNAALIAASDATRAIAKIGRSPKHHAIAHKNDRVLYQPLDPLTSLKDADKVALLEKLERYARAADPRVTQVMASLAAEYDVIFVARSDGHQAADVRPLVRLSLQVITEQDGRREQGSAGGGGRFSYEYFTDDILKNYAELAVHQALTNLSAKPAPAGTMTVVLGAGWPGILLHEAIGHGLEGDFNRKGSSAFSGRVGERVAATGVTVVDDGTLANRRGSLNIDDEGNTTQCTTLIENGILKGYM
ncbi:MAG: metallopeptidase TldD-related protein, partial [Sulfuriferula sp.]